MNTLKLTPMTAVFLIASLLTLSCGEKDKTMGPTIDEIEIIETDHSQDEPPSPTTSAWRWPKSPNS